KFQVKLEPAAMVEMNGAQIKPITYTEVMKIYRQKEMEFPVTVAMARFMSEKERSGPGGQRYDREGIYRWTLTRFGKKVESASGGATETTDANNGGAGGTGTMVVAAVAPPPVYTLTHLGMSEEDFRTQSRSKIHELLLESARKAYPPIGHGDI